MSNTKATDRFKHYISSFQSKSNYPTISSENNTNNRKHYNKTATNKTWNINKR